MSVLFTIMICFLAASCFFCRVSTFSLPPDEYQALYDLFSSTNGINWTWETPYEKFGYPWEFTTPSENPCSTNRGWQGVLCSSSCDTVPCTILSLTLSNHTLHGSIQSSLGNNLPALQLLDLSHNHLVGTIPSTIGNLLQLNILDLGYNRMDGSIPPSVGNLTRLQILQLTANRLTGSLPDTLWQLQALQYLLLPINKITGTLSPSISNLTQLQEVSLSKTKMTGTLPVTLGDITSLLIIEISYTLLTGVLPSSLGNLYQLKQLWLQQNLLTGTIPTSIGFEAIADPVKDRGKLSNLQILMLDGNYLTGTIPSSLGSLPSITLLYLDVNRMEGSLPSELGNLTTLTEMAFYRNRLTGTIPASLSNLPELGYLYLDFNLFSGTLPETIGNLTKLQYLYVEYNHLTGTIPSSIKDLRLLEQLFLEFNELTGTLPDSLGNLRSLIAMFLNGNKFTGTIPESLSKLVSLTALSLYKNYLTGTIPSYLGNPNILVDLLLYDNLLTGTIPSSYANKYPMLVDLALFANELTGTIENQFLVNLPYISLFGLDNNQLTGALPSFNNSNARGDFAYLFLNNNFFSSTIPSSLGNQTKLEYIALNDNILSGKVSLLGERNANNISFPVLLGIDLSNNVLSGNIDFVKHLGSIVRYSYLNNNLFDGSIPGEAFRSEIVLLASNCFSGPLPPDDSICGKVTLRQAILDGLHSAPGCIQRAVPIVQNSGYIMKNGVYGTIPPCLLQMPIVSVLHFGGNSISGSIPNVPISKTLHELILPSNHLTGDVPDHLWHSNITVLDLSLNRLKGTLPHDMLPSLKTDQNASLKLQVNAFSGNIPLVLKDLESVDILQGNLFSCDFSRSSLPMHDPKYKSYDCGSDITNYSLVLFAIVGFAGLSILWLGRQSSTTVKYDVDVDEDALKVISLIQKSTLTLAIYIIGFGLIVYGTLAVYFSTYVYSYIWAASAIYVGGVDPAIVIFLLLTGLVMLCFLLFYGLFRDIEMSDSQTHKHEVVTISKYQTFRNLAWNAVIITANIVVVVGVNGGYVYTIGHVQNIFFSVIVSVMISIFKLVWNQAVLGDWSVSVLETTLSDWAISSVCLFNNLIAPLLAELVVSPDCFFYIVNQAPQLSFFYNPFSCDIVTTSIDGVTRSYVECNLNLFTDTNLLVPSAFSYSYQCSFALISDYAYVFILRYVILFIAELSIVYLDTSNLAGRHPVIRKLVPPMLRLHRLLDRQLDETRVILDDLERLFQHSYNIRRKIISRFAIDLVIMICIGGVFPPLAVVITISILKDCWMIRQGWKHIEAIKQKTQYEEIRIRLNGVQKRFKDELEGAGTLLRDSMKLGVCISVLIWAFILYDIIAPYVSGDASIGIALLMLFFPYAIILIASYLFRNQVKQEQVQEQDDDGHGDDIVEVSSVINPVFQERDTLASRRSSTMLSMNIE